MNFAFVIGVFGLILMLPFFIMIGWHYWSQIFVKQERWPLYFVWILRGLAFPLIAWTLLNSGLFFGYAPLIPDTAAAANNGFGALLVSLLYTLPITLVVIASFWSLITFIWMQWRLYYRVEDRNEYLLQCGFWSLFLVPVVVLILYNGRIDSLATAMLFILIPLTHFTVPMINIARVKPMYSGAQAMLKFGKYAQAESEIINQLEKDPDNYDGWIMLAEIYALRHGDVSEADQLIRQLCNQETTTELQKSRALYRLSEWYLTLEKDPVAARETLEHICTLMPETHGARMAKQKIAQLPPTREAFEEQSKPQRVKFAEEMRVGEEAGFYGVPKINDAESEKLRLLFQSRLKDYPDDVEVRERLAVVQATHFENGDEAILNLEWLLKNTGPREKKEVEWLNLLATWHLRFNLDTSAARTTLEKIIQKFPDDLYAFNAKNRIQVLDIEIQKYKPSDFQKN